MSKTFCPLPWKEIASTPTGSVRLCCSSVSGLNLSKHADGSVAQMTENLEAGWNTPFFQEVRAQMKSGDSVSACTNCYKLEASGSPSPRTAWLQKFPDMDPADLPTTVGLDQVEQLDLRMGNTCNLRCRMCGPYSSSAWTMEWPLLGDLVSQPDEKGWQRIRKANWAEDSKSWEQIQKLVPSLKRVYLTGGEPFLVSLNKKFLASCVSSGEASHIELRYNTNGTVWDPDLPELWAQFQKVKVRVSIDGLGALNEYIRYPSRWQQILSNLDLLENATRIAPVEISIASTIQAYNVFHVSEFLRFFQDRNLPVYLDVVHQPSFLSVGVLSPQKTKLARQRLEPMKDYPGVENLLHLLNSSHHNQWDEFVAFTMKLDDMRKQNLNEIVPEFAQPR
ncbi:twitch domain-containing radical SAM protein [Bdellovibrio sp. HCB2-146]|uniref:twitch domain-containing radical SAM protein n=1 Tax=Bdellovibrio sp. HCB2-146 TaxID=3394362 RepID=UPI0039BC790B